MSDNNPSITLQEYGEAKEVELTPEQHTYIKEKINTGNEKLGLDHIRDNIYKISAKQYVGSMDFYLYF